MRQFNRDAVIGLSERLGAPDVPVLEEHCAVRLDETPSYRRNPRRAVRKLGKGRSASELPLTAGVHRKRPALGPQCAPDTQQTALGVSGDVKPSPDDTKRKGCMKS
jgi:hypothetical protein